MGKNVLFILFLEPFFPIPASVIEERSLFFTETKTLNTNLYKAFPHYIKRFLYPFLISNLDINILSDGSSTYLKISLLENIRCLTARYDGYLLIT